MNENDDEEKVLLDPPVVPSSERRGSNSQRSSYSSIRFSQDPSRKRYALQFRRRKQDKESSSTTACVSLNAVEFALKTMHEQIPAVCIMGMERLEGIVEDVAIDRSADMVYSGEHKGSPPLHTLKGEAKLQRLYEKQLIIDAVQISVSNKMDDQKHTTPLQWAIFLGFLQQMLMGYNIGVLNATHPLFAYPAGSDIAVWALIVSGLAAGGILGSLIAGPLADSRGRKMVIVSISVLYTSGGVLQAFFSSSLHILILARVLIGLASGLCSIVLPIYLGELCPPIRRGKVGNLLQYAAAMGLLLGYALQLVLRHDSLLYSALLTAFVGFIQLLLSPMLVESPRWILTKDPQSAKARTILALLRDSTDKETIEHEAFHLTCANNAHLGERIGLRWRDAIPSDPEQRKLALNCLVLHIIQQLSGSSAVFYYSSSMLKNVLYNPEMGTLFVGVANLLAVVGTHFLLKWTGLRRWLSASAGGMTLCWMVLTLTLSGHFTKELASVSLLFFVIFYEIGFGATPMLLLAEWIDTGSVISVMPLCVQISWLFHFIVALIFPFLQMYVGPYSFLLFVICLGASDVYVRVCVPFNRGQTARTLYINLTAQRPVESMHTK